LSWPTPWIVQRMLLKFRTMPELEKRKKDDESRDLHETKGFKI
jgi:hypothetical protein